MKSLGIFSEDYELINNFRKIEYFDSVEKIGLEDLEHKVYDVVVASDRLLSLNDFKDYKGHHEMGKCFYMVSNHNLTNMSHSMLKAEGIEMVPPRLTVSQVVKCVIDKTQNTLTSTNKIFTFFGADTKVGTTMISQCVCEKIAQINDRVIYVSLSGQVGNDYTTANVGQSLDLLKTKLQTKVLRKNELSDICKRTEGGYYFLPGPKNRLMLRHYHPEQISYLIEMLEDLFDVIIVDAGSNIELGMTISALNSTPNRFLVTTQQELAFQRFKDLEYQVLKKLSIDQFLLIVNKNISNPALNTPAQLAKKYGLSHISCLPFMEYGWQCEQEKMSLNHFSDDIFSKGVQNISKLIAVHLDLKIEEDEGVKSGVFGKWFSKRRVFKKPIERVVT